MGVAVDPLLAGSMVALDVVDRRRRDSALVDAVIAASFVLAGALAVRRSTTDQHLAMDSVLDRLRQTWADRLAGVLVPGYRTRFTAARLPAGAAPPSGSRQGSDPLAGSNLRQQR